MKKPKARNPKSRYGPVPVKEPGAPPATLAPIPGSAKSTAQVLAYGPDEVWEHELAGLTGLTGLRKKLSDWPVAWVHVSGLGSVEGLNEIATAFGLHPLALEDVLSGSHRPKVEEYGEYLFMVLQIPVRGEKVRLDQIAIFFNRRLIITFQDRPESILAPLKERIRKSAGRLRRQGADYLAYAILDTIIDCFFPILEQYDETLSELEDQVIDSPDAGTMARIHEIKRELKTVRRALWPLRDVMNHLLDEEPSFIAEEIRPFLRDCYDHVIQAIDLVEVYREVGADLSDIYLSSLSHRMNQVMKVLTIIATIFIPLTFVAGLYGMNFRSEVSPWNMPELSWRYGYPAVLGLMVAIALGMLWYFKKNKWL